MTSDYESNSVSLEIKELSLLFEISKKLSESLDLKAALKFVLQIMAENMEMPRSAPTILNSLTTAPSFLTK